MSLVQFISNGTAKTKLAILAFLYCGEFVENLYYWKTRFGTLVWTQIVTCVRPLCWSLQGYWTSLPHTWVIQNNHWIAQFWHMLIFGSSFHWIAQFWHMLIFGSSLITVIENNLRKKTSFYFWLLIKKLKCTIITSNYWKTCVNRVWIWIFEWAIVNRGLIDAWWCLDLQ